MPDPEHIRQRRHPMVWPSTLAFRLHLLFFVFFVFFVFIPVQAQELDGEHIMTQAQRRHQQFPYVYEKQTMILVDAAGNRRVRQSRLYTRMQAEGSVKFLLIFDQPEEIRGVALLAKRSAEGAIQSGIYLPAFGPVFKRPRGSGLDDQFLGTDFSITDLTPEPIADYRYVRRPDRQIEGQLFFVVDAYPKSVSSQPESSFGLRKHLLRKDNFMIVQTDIYDANLHLYKRIGYYDLHRVDGESWRANIIIADDHRENHRTILKIDRRIYSQDYVPEKLFEESYLLANRHIRHPASGNIRSRISIFERKLMERNRD